MSTDSILAERAEIDATFEGKTLCDLLAETATAYPDHPALSWKVADTWRTLSWAEFRERAAKVAMGLRSLGVDRGDFVAIMASNRPEHLIADMGTVHAGATPVSLYNTLAPDQVAYIVGHCGAKAAIVEGPEFMAQWEKVMAELPRLEHMVLLEHADQYADTAVVRSWAEVMDIGRQALAADESAFEASWRAVRPDDLATLVYTSGTTGPPKGVMLTHRNVLWTIVASQRVVQSDIGTCEVSYLPFAHTMERSIYYGGIAIAGHFYFCPDIAQVFQCAAETHPQVFLGVPRVWEKLQAGILAELATQPAVRRRIAERAIAVGRQAARLGRTGRTVPIALSLQRSLFDRLVYSKIRNTIGLDRCDFAGAGAAPIAPGVLEFFSGMGIRIQEAYGMTECSGPATLTPKQAIRIGWVGPAMPGVEIRLAEDGEVLVRGGNVAAGYYKDPEQTEQTFDSQGWLHTGDIGELSADGWLRVIDRKKELIITGGGKNISPSNLEGQLKRHPLVADAFAFGDRKPYVVALVVLDAEVAPGWARTNGVPLTSLAEFAVDSRVRAEIDRAVQAANDQVSKAEQIKRHMILPTQWTVGSELTPTLKVRRRVIQDKYAAELESLYES